ncbi:LANO_0G02762g1_1 [Lachancea nothofagi CBS 11611]|uniref:LANO_0G02762g1_1 n=1 Tax=Lachancea nothofagi CBS 11611 TaxID=1266666 RepID=A0A1G4KF71_9SACH|nr:LANO_0G02762g1_1 [Lachancea nothofagi CBS 11611]
MRSTDLEEASANYSKFFAKCQKEELQDENWTRSGLKTSSRFTEYSGKKNPVISLEFNQLGSYLAYSRSDESLNIWKLKADRSETYTLVRDIPGLQKRQICDMSWHPMTGFLLSTVGGTNCIIVYDVSTGALAKRIDVEANFRFYKCEYNPSGRWLAVFSEDGRFCLFDADQNYELLFTSQLYEQHSENTPDLRATSVIWSHSGDSIYAAFNSGEIRSFHVQDTGLREIMRVSGHTGPVNCLKLDPAGSILLAGGQDTTCSIWELTSMCCTGVINDFSDSIRDMDLCHNGLALALSSPTQCKIYALDTRESLYQLSFTSEIESPKFRYFPGKMAFVTITENENLAKYNVPDPVHISNQRIPCEVEKRKRGEQKTGVLGVSRREEEPARRGRFSKRPPRR